MENALCDNKLKFNSMKNSERGFEKLNIQYTVYSSCVGKPTTSQSCLFSVLQVNCITGEEESCGKLKVPKTFYSLNSCCVLV